jgi:hypothetical protein
MSKVSVKFRCRACENGPCTVKTHTISVPQVCIHEHGRYDVNWFFYSQELEDMSKKEKKA